MHEPATFLLPVPVWITVVVPENRAVSRLLNIALGIPVLIAELGPLRESRGGKQSDGAHHHDAPAPLPSQCGLADGACHALRSASAAVVHIHLQTVLTVTNRGYSRFVARRFPGLPYLPLPAAKLVWERYPPSVWRPPSAPFGDRDPRHIIPRQDTGVTNFIEPDGHLVVREFRFLQIARAHAGNQHSVRRRHDVWAATAPSK